MVDMSESAPAQGLVESDILPFLDNNSPKAADDPMGTVMSFLNAGLMFGAMGTMLDAVDMQVGAMPAGTGFEAMQAEMRNMAPAPTAPTMNGPQTLMTPGMGGPS